MLRATTNVAEVLNKHCSRILIVEDKYTTVQPARIKIIASEIVLVNKRMFCRRNGQTVSRHRSEIQLVYSHKLLSWAM
jgi:hypothetical protein